MGQVGQEFQVEKAGKKGQEGQVGQVGQVGWCVKVWEGGPEGSGGVNRTSLYCAFSDLLLVGVFINDWTTLFVETVSVSPTLPQVGDIGSVYPSF